MGDEEAEGRDLSGEREAGSTVGDEEAECRDLSGKQGALWGPL